MPSESDGKQTAISCPTGFAFVASFPGFHPTIRRLSSADLPPINLIGRSLEFDDEILWTFKRQACKMGGIYPIGSMYGKFTYIWLFLFMVNVCKYT